MCVDEWSSSLIVCDGSDACCCRAAAIRATPKVPAPPVTLVPPMTALFLGGPLDRSLLDRLLRSPTSTPLSPSILIRSLTLPKDPESGPEGCLDAVGRLLLLRISTAYRLTRASAYVLLVPFGASLVDFSTSLILSFSLRSCALPTKAS